jgi:hypothetical protein
MTKQALPPQITTMHFNIIRSGHTNGRLSTSLLSLYYIACAVTICLEATIGYIAHTQGAVSEAS